MPKDGIVKHDRKCSTLGIEEPEEPRDPEPRDPPFVHLRACRVRSLIPSDSEPNTLHHAEQSCLRSSCLISTYFGDSQTVCLIRIGYIVDSKYSSTDFSMTKHTLGECLLRVYYHCLLSLTLRVISDGGFLTTIHNMTVVAADNAYLYE